MLNRSNSADGVEFTAVYDPERDAFRVTMAPTGTESPAGRDGDSETATEIRLTVKCNTIENA